jgi:hypothetical protein
MKIKFFHVYYKIVKYLGLYLFSGELFWNFFNGFKLSMKFYYFFPNRF